MELDHIVPKGEGGDDSIGNAIPLCFECHAEVHAYNDDIQEVENSTRRATSAQDPMARHLRGAARGSVAGALNTGVGPLQALMDELDFNIAAVPIEPMVMEAACPFSDAQFRRALAAGSISVLEDSLKAILSACVKMGAANRELEAAFLPSAGRGDLIRNAHARMRIAEQAANEARAALLSFLASEH